MSQRNKNLVPWNINKNDKSLARKKRRHKLPILGMKEWGNISTDYIAILK